MRQFKVMYVAPRYHTNQYPIMKGWHEIGVKVRFLAQYCGAIESHKYVELHLMKPSLLTKLRNGYIERKYNKVEIENKERNIFRPGFWDVIIQVRSFKPDVVILRNYSLGNLKIYLICRLLGIRRVLMYVQSPIYGTPKSNKSIKEKVRCAMFPHAVFSPVLYRDNNRSKESFSGWARWFVPLIYDKPKEIRREYCKDGIIHLLTIGKYREYKKHYLLVDAIKMLKNRDKFKVTIIGQMSNDVEASYYNKLNEYVMKEGLDNIISVQKDVPYEEIGEIYKNHDLFVLCSKEPASISILESMYYGLCVISSSQNGTSCYLDEYNCGFVFDNSNPGNLACELEKLSCNYDIIKEFGQKGQKVISEKLSFDNYLSSINDVLQGEYNYSIKDK